MTLFISGIALTSVQGIENVSYEAGYVEWEMDFEQRLYVEGEDAETSVLQRERPDATLAFALTLLRIQVLCQSFHSHPNQL